MWRQLARPSFPEIQWKILKFLLGFSGSILNRLFVLTAAHCLCNHYAQCRLRPDFRGEPAMKIAYNPTQILKLEVGRYHIHDRSDSSRVLSVANIIIHPDYRGSNHDIALIELQNPLVFDYFNIGPICLPFSGRFPDKGDGFVTGWSQKKFDECHTGPHGPTPFRWDFKDSNLVSTLPFYFEDVQNVYQLLKAFRVKKQCHIIYIMYIYYIILYYIYILYIIIYTYYVIL